MHVQRWRPAVADLGRLRGRLLGGLRTRIADAVTIVCTSRADAPPIPPRHLRRRVHGKSDVASFLDTGRRCASEIVSIAGDHDLGARAADVLDFGCGCGRVLGWVSRSRPEWTMYGCDIDAEAVEWASTAHPRAGVRVNEHNRSAPVPDRSIDLLYAVSVFTHVDLPDQEVLLDDFARMLRPGALAVLSLHGRQAVPLSDEAAARFDQEGFVFVQGDLWSGVFPSWYQTAVHSEALARELLARHDFDVLDYLPKGLNGHQDLIVARRRPAPPPQRG